jgi:Xaa-Pro dipeptidase
VSEASPDALYPQHLATLMRRADQALEESGFDALVVHAGVPPLQFLDDQSYPFKVNPQFKAWVPILDNPQCVLIYRPGSRPKVLFHQPDDYWHLPARLPDAPWTACVDLETFADPARVREAIAALAHPALVGPRELFADSPERAVNPPALITRLHFARAVKTPYEIECLRRASDLGVLGHGAARAAWLAGASEYEAHQAYLAACQQREEEMPYNNIIAYNEHSAVLHYQHLDRRPPPVRRSFLIDAGAQFRGYAADITRSHAAAPGAFAELVQHMEALQLKLCDLVVAGRDYREIHIAAHRAIGQLLLEVGLTRIPAEAALERGVTTVFFPHGVGHLLGLQVHDVGGVQANADGGERERPPGHATLRLTRMLEPGVVVTVEPGLYFIDTLLKAAQGDARRGDIDWTRVEALKPFGGIRIEDNVVATADTPENLTRAAFARAAPAPAPSPSPPRERTAAA